MNNEFINPGMVPQRILRSGDKMPGIGMGTFGSDRFSAEEIAATVKGAAETGYRLFDCASVYGNENMIGEVFGEIIQSGIKREELFITSKVWNDMHGKGDVLLSCAKTLKDLRLDYMDLYFVHWPFRNFHPKGAAPDYHNSDARPFSIEKYMETWYQMERLQKAGYVKNIGVSNMTIPKLKELMKYCTIMPAAHEMELHPCFQQQELFAFCVDKGILPIGYCPIGSPNRPERDKTAEDYSDTEEPVIVEIAKAHNVHPALICLKWAVQRGQTPIPFSVDRKKYVSNLRCVVEDPLAEEEMKKIEGVDKNCRLIKGQVFLWDGAKDWTELWDEA
ncbi:MAG: aldo/keto reductase [Eubacterium sp.]|jgi:alcohol dehydrogenase (NADP+)|nr:aldo/keto reductase [Eubacterium sp.]